MNAGRKLLVAMMLGVTAAISGNNPIWSALNPSFPRGNDRLQEPIIIPHLAAHTQAPFSSTSRTTQTQQIKNNTKARGYFVEKIYNPDESLSQESKIDVKFTDESKADDNSLKFSSRYSSKPDSSEESKESSEESEDKSAGTSDVGPVTFEHDKILSGNEAIPGKENYKTFSDRSENPDPTYLDAGEDEKSDIRRYSDANEPRETEELDVSPATNEPYPALQRPTSFQNSHYPDEESENYETSSEVSRENENPTEEKNTDYQESGPEDYGSVQTPLKEIKFRGPHSVKDDFESERSIARLSPIRRHPISYNWPYSKAQLKEADKLNGISDETVESEEGTKISGLAQVDDEVELRQNKKPRDRKNELSKGEKTDQKGLLYQYIKPYVTEPQKKQPKVHPKKIHAPKPRPRPIIVQDLWSGLTPTKTALFDELFSRQSKKVKPAEFNITKEPNSPSHQFLLFKQNPEQTKTKPSEEHHVKKKASKELEKTETIDRLNLGDQKIQKTILSGADARIPSQTFDYQEESDEMYNQILSNIQSVFGLRTQPVDSARENQELDVEENRALTWALPLRKREKAKPEISDGESESKKVKSGRDLNKSLFPGRS